jgi:hypothetical protein
LKACIGWRPARLSERQPFRPTWFRRVSIDPHRDEIGLDWDEMLRKGRGVTPTEREAGEALETIAQTMRRKGYKDLKA